MITEEKKTTLLRATIVYLAIVLFGFRILYKIYVIQFVEADLYKEIAEDKTISTEVVEADRGNIFADDGTLLLTSVPRYDIFMDVACKNLPDSTFYDNINALSANLSNLFGIRSTKYYRDKLTKDRKNNIHYRLIKRDVTNEQVKKLKTFPIFDLGRYKGGLIIKDTNKRIKLNQGLAHRTLGFLSEKGKTKEYVGLEGAYNKELSGINGKRLMQKIGDGAKIPIYQKNQLEPQNGHDIHTTLNLNIQYVAESSLKNKLIEHDAEFGTAIVMETKTGYIQAIVNLGKDGRGNYYEAKNYAVGTSEAPGSTFKLASYLAALDDNLLPPLTSLVDCGNGSRRIHGKEMTDAHRGGYGILTVREVFEKSSNIGTSELIMKAYPDYNDFYAKMKQFHLTDSLHIDIIGEGRPYIQHPNSEYYSKITLPWLSIGYESFLTPLQILTFYNAIANDGKMMKPQFVKRITSSGKTIKEFPPYVIDKAIASPAAIDTVQSLLEGVVQRGTATNLNNTAFRIAGKTGTAKVAKGKHGYTEKQYRASFAGYFPAHNPQFTVFVMVSNPTKGSYYGNVVAGSVFEDIANKIYATHIEIQDEEIEKEISAHPPILVVGSKTDLNKVYQELGYTVRNPEIDSKWVVSMQYQDTLRFGHRVFKQDEIPNVKGMSGKDAIYLLEKLGLKVVVHGKGKVSRQSVLAGTRVTKGRKIILHLS